jgi:sugar O-acyltransferase (sialic acid O-acetyltransferase NeuD family)
MADDMGFPLIVIGAGGHAKVLIEALRQLGRSIIGIVETPDFQEKKGPFGVEIIGDDSAIFEYPAASVELVNGIGSLPGSNARWKLYQMFAVKGYRFASVTHPRSCVAEDVVLAEGCQIMAGAVVQPGTRIGRQAIVNTSASIDHDCHLGDGVHIAPGATLCGGVRVGDHAHIGAGASVIQSLSIGPNAVVGAGSVVVKNVADGAVVKSIAAKPSGADI